MRLLRKIREAIKNTSLALCVLHKHFVGVCRYVAGQIDRQNISPYTVAVLQATAALYNLLGFPEHHAMELFVEYWP